MKKITILLTALFLAISLNVFAADVNVVAGSDLKALIEAGADGDVFILADGDYVFSKPEGSTDDYVDITKSVTLKAANAGKAVLTKYQFRVNEASTIDHIVFDGLAATFDETVDSKYFIQFGHASSAITKLEIKNCTVNGYGRGVIRATANKTAKIDNIVIDNSVFVANSKMGAGYAQINPQKCSVKSVTIKNSTFYDSKAALFRNTESNVEMTVLIENCTVLNCNSSGGRKMIELIAPKEGVPSNTIAFDIKNCIFSGSNDATAPADKQIDLVNVGVIDNSLLEGFSDPLYNRATETNPVNATVASFNIENFSITTDPSTVTGIGDPRWNLNSNGSSVDKIEANKEIRAIEYFDILGKKVRTEEANGLLIKKMIYVDGTSSSTKVFINNK